MSRYGRVAIVGAAMTPFDSHKGYTVEEIARWAVVDALGEAGVRRDDVQAVWCAHLYQGEVLGQRILRGLGFNRLPITNVENACASGSTAARDAWKAVGAGEFDLVLVIGAEKMGRGLVSFASADLELALGNIAPAQYALAARRHMHEFGTSAEAFARIAVKNRRHGSLNPHARFRDTVSIDEVLASRPIAEPITLLQCCRNGSGAAALVLASETWCRRRGAGEIRIESCGLSSALADRNQRDLTSFGATAAAAVAAYEDSGIGPEALDIVELHDAFAPGELLHYEGLGLCPKGEGGRLALDADTELGGRIPVNVSGGLLAKSHPLGATGVAQLVELTWQLRGQARGRQVEGARVALAHSQGGTGLEALATSVTIMTRA